MIYEVERKQNHVHLQNRNFKGFPGTALAYLMVYYVLIEHIFTTQAECPKQ